MLYVFRHGVQDKVADLELQLQETIIESETSESSLLERITVSVFVFVSKGRREGQDRE